MKEKISCVYAIVSPSNRAYIGSTTDFHNRQIQHRWKMKKGNHPSPALNAAVKKYGLDNMDFVILERCEKEGLIEREQWWIDNHRTQFGRMYNASGIAGRPEHTPEVREKISRANRGRECSEETREKHRARMTGTRHTPETIQKMRQSAAGNEVAKLALARAIELRRGKPHKPESIEKMRAAKLGKVDSEQVRESKREGQRKRYERDGGLSEAAKEKLRGPRGKYNLDPEKVAAAVKKRKATREASGKNKVTDDQVREIRRSTLTNRELGEAYGIHPTTASAIRRRVHRADVV